MYIEMDKGRSVVVNKKRYTEDDVRAMNIDQISMLSIEITESINSLSSEKRKLADAFLETGIKDPKYRTYTWMINKLHEAEMWIAVIKRQKSCEEHKESELAKAFYKVCQEELKPKDFEKLVMKAKMLVLGV